MELSTRIDVLIKDNIEISNNLTKKTNTVIKFYEEHNFEKTFEF